MCTIARYLKHLRFWLPHLDFQDVVQTFLDLKSGETIKNNSSTHELHRKGHAMAARLGIIMYNAPRFCEAPIFL